MSKWLEGRVAGQTRWTERLFGLLRTGASWQRFRRVTLVHATRIAADRAYREIIDEKVRMHPKQFGFDSWLREAKRNRFLLTAPPLRLPGAVGSPAVAVATV